MAPVRTGLSWIWAPPAELSFLRILQRPVGSRGLEPPASAVLELRVGSGRLPQGTSWLCGGGRRWNRETYRVIVRSPSEVRGEGPRFLPPDAVRSDSASGRRKPMTRGIQAGTRWSTGARETTGPIGRTRLTGITEFVGIFGGPSRHRPWSECF